MFRFDCDCDRGYEGYRCETEVNECLSNPCQHGAHCQDRLATYECACTIGYTGKVQLHSDTPGTGGWNDSWSLLLYRFPTSFCFVICF